MEAELKKKTILIGEKIFCDVPVTLAEGDIIVPDIKPDIMKIVFADATAQISQTTVSNGYMTTKGTVMVNILYVPESENGEECVEAINTKFDFSEEIKIDDEKNISATATCQVRHIDFSLINSRKMSVKVYILITPSLCDIGEIEFIDARENKDRLEIKEKNVGVYSADCEEVRDIVVNENINVPSDKADIGEVLKIDMTARFSEVRAMTNKLLVKGILDVNILYKTCDSEETLEYLCAEIPFSDVFDVQNICEDSIVCVKFNVKDYYYKIKNDINDRPRTFSFEALIDVLISSGTIRDISVCEDCYIPKETSETVVQNVSGYEIISSENESIKVKSVVKSDEGAISNVCFLGIKPIITEEIKNDYGIKMNGLAVCSVFYKTNDDSVHFKTQEIPFSYDVEVENMNNEICFDYHISLCDKNYSVQGDEINISAEICLCSNVYRPIEFCVATDCSISQTDSCVAPTTLVIYFVQKGDTLWDIAKKYKTGEQKIIELNQNIDTSKLTVGTKLLIPTI